MTHRERRLWNMLAEILRAIDPGDGTEHNVATVAQLSRAWALLEEFSGEQA